jgi:type VI secretion system protein ImpE
MSSLSQLMADRSLAETLLQVENQVRARPADADSRAALVQLLCLSGQWSRASTLLKSWLALAPNAKPTVTLLEQLIAAEQQREQVFAGQTSPVMPQQHYHWLGELLESLALQQQGQHQQAQTLREQAFEGAELNPAKICLSGQQSEQQVEWLIDGDSRLGPVCELMVNGHYYWVPFTTIEQIQFQAPSAVTDLIWRHCCVTFVDGKQQVCQIPARYPLQGQWDDALLLAQATSWQALGADGHYLGQGQKIWLNDQQEFLLLDLKAVNFVPVLATEQDEQGGSDE